MVGSLWVGNTLVRDASRVRNRRGLPVKRVLPEGTRSVLKETSLRYLFDGHFHAVEGNNGFGFVRHATLQYFPHRTALAGTVQKWDVHWYRDPMRNICTFLRFYNSKNNF